MTPSTFAFAAPLLASAAPRGATSADKRPAKRAASALTAAAAAAAALCLSTPRAALAYGLVDGRLDKCRGDVPCVSTASVANPSKFGAPWTYQPQTDDPEKAWAALKDALLSNKDGGKIVESVDGPNLYYMRAEFPSSFRGIDDLEFRLIQQEALVTYRSASREAIFLYPLQTPINTDKNKTRLLDIRRTLGWDELAAFNPFGIDDGASASSL